jgi:hypothetical protein
LWWRCSLGQPAAWGAPVVVFASEAEWATCAAELGPAGMISSVLAVGGDVSMAVSVSNFGLMATDVQRITAGDPMKLGVDVVLTYEAVAWLADPPPSSVPCHDRRAGPVRGRA